MCGIVGFIDKKSFNYQESKNIISLMNKSLFHRGPDDGDFWLDQENHLALAHRRLSIIDISSAGRQPMKSHTSRYILTYNGEIYNHRELRFKLEREKKSPRWIGNSDTETMLACFEAYGFHNSIQKFVGMFSLALWDQKLSCLYLARDRIGEKPLYYGNQGGLYFFASELKAIKAHPKFQDKINRNALSLYLRHNYIPAPFSIYENVFKLPAGNYIRLGIDKTPKVYWSLEKEILKKENNFISFNNCLDDLNELLTNTIRLQMSSDVPLGAFLSGGVDSSLIVAMMQEISSKPIETFTIGFAEKEYDEAKYAKNIANFLGTNHNEHYMSPKETIDVIPSLCRIYDEPFSDSSQIPTSLISKIARKKVTVSLSGDGGDEIFGGYNRYTWVKNIWKGIKFLPYSVRRKMAHTIFAFSPKFMDRLILPVMSMLPEKYNYKTPGDKIKKIGKVLDSKSLEETYLKLISHWEYPEDLVINSLEPLTLLNSGKNVLENFSIEEKMMFLDTMTYLPDDILVKVDRASMNFSLETRMPFLDHRVIDFAWKLPLKFKIKDGERKYIINKLLRKKIPKDLIDRPKMGFAVPLDNWLRGPLKDWAENLLDKNRIKNEGYFNCQLITEKWEQHKTGDQNWQYHLWDILMFESWLENNKI